MTHICVGKLTIIGSDNGLSPGRRQAIIWTNAEILLIGPLGTNFSEILIGILTFSFKKMRLKMASVKWRPFCLGLNVLMRFCGIHLNTIPQQVPKQYTCSYENEFKSFTFKISPWGQWVNSYAGLAHGITRQTESVPCLVMPWLHFLLQGYQQAWGIKYM